MKNFHLLVAGGTGFIGQALVDDRLKRGDEITVLGRSINKIQRYYGNSIRPMAWEQLNTEKLSQVDVVINLAGESISGKRWSKQRKAAILHSRTFTTQRLANLCAELAESAPRVFNASAISIYGTHPSTSIANETTPIVKPPFPDFLTEVAFSWEEATQVANTAGVKVINLRFGVVLDVTGGILKKLWLPFQLGLGHIIGDGQQKISWVSLTDVVNSIDTLLRHEQLTGPINIVSPNIISQREFANTLAKYLHRPCCLTLSKPIILLLFGQMGQELFLSSRCATPDLLKQCDYNFITPTLKDCFSNLS